MTADTIDPGHTGLPPATAPSASTRRRLARFPWTVLYVAVLPPAAFYLYGIAPFYIQNGVDPFIYTGYTFRASDLIERYGYPYYSVRFSLLIPAQLTAHLFGVAGGYFVLRWLLIAGASAVGVMWCRRIRAPELVWLCPALLVVNPIVIRAVMTVYTDTVGVPCAFAASALVLMPGNRRQRLVACAGAGALFGMVFNTNLYFALPFGVALAVWLLVRLVVGWRDALWEGLVLGVAIAAVTAAGALWYWWRYGDPDIIGPSLDAARRLSDIVPADRAPTRQWLDFRPYLWLPLVAVGLLVAILVRQRTRPTWYEVASVGMMGAISIVLLYDEFLTKTGYFLQTYFYTSFFVGPTIIIFVLAIRRITAMSPSPPRLGVALAVAVLIFPFVWHLALDDLRVWALPTIPILLALTSGLLVVRRRGADAVLAITMAISIQLLTLAIPRNVPLAAGQPYRREPYYDQSMFQPRDQTLDRYELAADFMELVPLWSDTPGSVVFWYPEASETANLMGSTYLWYETTLTIGAPGLPELDADAAAHLAGRTPRFLVLVTEDEATSDDGLRAVERVVTPRSHERHSLSRGAAQVVVDVLELDPGSCDLDLEGREVYWRTQPPCAEA